jgi:hypothetical protein
MRLPPGVTGEDDLTKRVDMRKKVPRTTYDVPRTTYGTDADADALGR